MHLLIATTYVVEHPGTPAQAVRRLSCSRCPGRAPHAADDFGYAVKVMGRLLDQAAARGELGRLFVVELRGLADVLLAAWVGMVRGP
jgi:hypothetical protein